MAITGESREHTEPNGISSKAHTPSRAGPIWLIVPNGPMFPSRIRDALDYPQPRKKAIGLESVPSLGDVPVYWRSAFDRGYSTR